MDIQKEREAFEKWYRENYDNSVIDDSEFSEILNEYESNYYWTNELNQSWKAWYEAKAQAVPEGFVLLSHEDVNRLMSTIDFLGVKALGDKYMSFSEIHKIFEEWQEQGHENK